MQSSILKICTPYPLPPPKKRYGNQITKSAFSCQKVASFKTHLAERERERERETERQRDRDRERESV